MTEKRPVQEEAQVTSSSKKLEDAPTPPQPGQYSCNFTAANEEKPRLHTIQVVRATSDTPEVVDEMRCIVAKTEFEPGDIIVRVPINSHQEGEISPDNSLSYKWKSFAEIYLNEDTKLEPVE